MKLIAQLARFLIGKLKPSRDLSSEEIVAIPKVEYFRLGKVQHEDTGYGFSVSFFRAIQVDPCTCKPIRNGKRRIIYQDQDEICVVAQKTEHPQIWMKRRLDELNKDLLEGRLDYIGTKSSEN